MTFTAEAVTEVILESVSADGSFEINPVSEATSNYSIVYVDSTSVSRTFEGSISIIEMVWTATNDWAEVVTIGPVVSALDK
jgi:hypothetical protein